MLELIFLLLALISFSAWSRRDYKYERIMAKQAELSARMALLRLTLVEEERAYQRVLEEHR